MREKRDLFRVNIARKGHASRGPEAASCEITELTPSGIGLQTPLAVLIGDRLEVEFPLSGPQSIIRCTIQVAHLAPPDLGGRIVAISPDHQRLLNQFIHEHATVSLTAC
jgi:hypothetical protein